MVPPTATGLKAMTTQADEVTQDPRWTTVMTRNPAGDGLFVYGVRSTGVYCRPSCPARRPNPRQVSFHTGPAAAEAAGFRPCKRCRPEEIISASVAVIAAACRTIECAETAPTAARLAASAGLSVSPFQRLFKAQTGLTPGAYAAAVRRRRTEDALRREPRITDAMYAAGFSSSGRFYAATNGMLGMTPTHYKAGGAGVQMTYAVGRASLGTVLVAMTDKGICAILLGDEASALIADLGARFPRARLEPAGPGRADWVTQAIALVDATPAARELPLDVRGTAFQHRVWTALQQVPVGSTVTYSALAAAIGAPTAVRAVARACAENPVAVAIPCHRAVRTDGALAGYRWGLDRKRALLAREGVTPTSRQRPAKRSS
jgi:AraC family transcriptional regulator of adaptative response/methylated-DNA-[protein]-cysteine methyltransferase